MALSAHLHVHAWVHSWGLGDADEPIDSEDSYLKLLRAHVKTVMDENDHDSLTLRKVLVLVAATVCVSQRECE